MISSLLIISSLSAFACGGDGYLIEPQGHWIFYTGYSSADANWQKKLNKAFRKENIAFWHDYVQKAVSKEDVEAALYDVYLLDDQTSNAFFRYLIDHKDKEALQYWMMLKASDSAYISNLRWKQSAWFYDEKNGERRWVWWNEDERPIHDLSISQVETLDETVINQCKNTKIRHRYILQMMRKHFYSRNYQGCIDVWEKYGKSVPKSVLRKQCLNYYGGALRRLDRDAEAAATYATIGYFNPRLHYDVNVLRKIYRQNPNNEAFEFMVQEFVNTYFDHNYIQNSNKEWWFTPPLYNLSETRKAAAFNSLADTILQEKKTKNPALWKSAQAALAYIDGNLETALSLLQQAEKMKGTPAVKDNIRMLRLIFNSLRTDIDKKYEETLLPDLKWLVSKINEGNPEEYFFGGCESFENPSATAHHVKVLRRTVMLGIIPHFDRMNMPYKHMAYQNLYDETVMDSKEYRDLSRQGKIRLGINGYGYTSYIHPPIYHEALFDAYLAPHDFGDTVRKVVADSTCWCLNFDYRTSFFALIDTSELKDLLRYVRFLKSGGNTPAEKFVIQHNYRDLNFYYELIATKYMRIEKYDSALVFLRKVSAKFPETQNIAYYISNKYNPFAEEWITKKEYQADFRLPFNPTKAYANQPSKATFCQQMLRLRKLMKSSKSEEERANAAYAYAVGLHQSTLGNAWALCYYENGYNGGEHWYHGVPGDERIQQHVQKRVDSMLDIAMKGRKDEIFTLKCKIMHSQQKESLMVEVRENDWDSYKVYKPLVRNTFCDLARDYYEDPLDSKDWQSSAWYY